MALTQITLTTTTRRLCVGDHRVPAAVRQAGRSAVRRVRAAGLRGGRERGSFRAEALPARAAWAAARDQRAARPAHTHGGQCALSFFLFLSQTHMFFLFVTLFFDHVMHRASIHDWSEEEMKWDEMSWDKAESIYCYGLRVRATWCSPRDLKGNLSLLFIYCTSCFVPLRYSKERGHPETHRTRRRPALANARAALRAPALPRRLPQSVRSMENEMPV